MFDSRIISQLSSYTHKYYRHIFSRYQKHDLKLRTPDTLKLQKTLKIEFCIRTEICCINFSMRPAAQRITLLTMHQVIPGSNPSKLDCYVLLKKARSWVQIFAIEFLDKITHFNKHGNHVFSSWSMCAWEPVISTSGKQIMARGSVCTLKVHHVKMLPENFYEERTIDVCIHTKLIRIHGGLWAGDYRFESWWAMLLRSFT